MSKRLHIIGLVFMMAAMLITAAACGKQGAGAGAGAGAGEQGEQAERQTKFTEAPKMEIDPNKTYEAEIQTSKGSFTIELFAKDAPITVNSFVFLAKHRYFEGIVFHRIVPDFVIQTGDPTGTGAGGPGYEFEDELNSPYQYEPGIVAMANAGPNTNGSQFFVCTGESSKVLNNYPDYTIFGRVKDGMDTVTAIGNTPVSGEVPLEQIAIEKITISEK
jgi:cyclophilin family peptidyl-prolyl cis-trans isomerase